MTLAEQIAARAVENGRTLAQQAAYERFMGDADTVREQREAGVIA